MSEPDPDTFAGHGWGVLGEHAYFLRPPRPDAPGRFVALDAATGEIVWEREVGAQETSDGWNAYSPMVQLHSLDAEEAAALPEEPGAAGSDHGVVLARSPRDGADLWAFRPSETTEFCTVQGPPLLQPGQDTGDPGRVVLAHACVSEEELAGLSLGGSFEDPLVFAGRAETLTLVITALDPSTGRVLWDDRRPITGPGDPVAPGPLDRSPAVVTVAGPDLARPFVNDPVNGREVRYPEEALDEEGSPIDPAGRTLRADTSGLVVAVDSGDEPYVPDTEWAFEALDVDPEGRVLSSVTVDEEAITPDHLAHAIALERTLLVPHLDTDNGRSQVYAAGPEAGEEGGTWLESLPASRTDAETEHRLPAVPGAVVSHLTDGATVTDVHALVP